MGNARWFPPLAAVLLLLFPTSPLLSESLPELLQPVDEQVIQRLQRQTNYAFRAQLYPAKRRRIVQIDFSLLQKKGAEFTITPFEDLQVRAVAVEPRGPSSSAQLQEWIGELVIPGVRIYTADSGEPWRPRLNLWIRYEKQVPLNVANQIAADRGETAAFGPFPRGASASDHAPAFTRLNFQTLSGGWFEFTRRARIVIESIEDDPRYHVIYEEDPDKVASGAHASEDTSRKLRAREEFMKQLEEERAADIGEPGR